MDNEVDPKAITAMLHWVHQKLMDYIHNIGTEADFWKAVGRIEKLAKQLGEPIFPEPSTES